MGNCDGGGGGVNSLFFTHEFTGGPATWCTQPTSVPPNAWTHVALAYDKASPANQPTIYINGTKQPITQIQQTNGNSFSDASGPLVLGNNSAAARAFDGSVDELSYAHGIRDPGWIRTSFDNQNAPNNFVTLGP